MYELNMNWTNLLSVTKENVLLRVCVCVCLLKPTHKRAIVYGFSEMATNTRCCVTRAILKNIDGEIIAIIVYYTPFHD